MEEDEKPAQAESAAAQLTTLWSKLSSTRKMMTVAILAALIGGLSWLSLREPPVERAVLFSGLSADDAGRVVQELQAKNVSYEIEANGTAISVPKDQVHELRLALASEGSAPTGGVGVGFELFDRQSFGTTNFVEQTNFRRAVEGELARTIASLGIVDRARVHIAMGKRSLYTRQDEPPTASVVLTLVAGQQLSSTQRRGIVNMVASSVDGLTADNVALVDGNGNALSNPGADMIGSEAAMDLERTLARRVERMLEPVVGPGNVAVTVTADLDRAHVERTEELYDQGPDKMALRSEGRIVQGDAALDNANGIAGARGNLPGTAGPGAGAAGAGAQHIEETKNYEVNRVVQKTIGPRQQVKRLHLAILVDEPLDEEGNPVPRTEEELKQLESIAREAAGLDQERGDGLEILSVPFVRQPVPEADLEPEAEPEPALPPMWMMIAAAAVAVLVIAGFVFWIIRRRRRRDEPEELQTTLPKTVEELENELPEDAHEDDIAAAAKPRLVDLPEAATYLERAAAMAGEDPELAARILRTWLGLEAVRPPAANTENYEEAA